MAAKIKLQRQGTKSKPVYRVVVQDESAARDSRVIEILGQYNPLLEPSLFNVNKDRVQEWLAKGAEPTEKVKILLSKAGLIPAIDLAALPKRKPKAEAKAEAEGKGAAAPAAAPAETKEEPKEEAKTEAPEPAQAEPAAAEQAQA